MSISFLPDELILEIYKRLIQFGSEIDSDGDQVESLMSNLNLAFTCKRFLHLAQNQFNRILEREFVSVPALHSVRFNSHFRDRNIDKPLRKFRLCPSHGLCGNWSRCYYRRLYPILAFKYINYTQISMGNYNFAYADCLLAMEDSTLDRITRLSLWRCTLKSQTLTNLARKIRNLCHMTLQRNEYFDDSDGHEVPFVEKTLWYLELLEDGETGYEHPLLRENLRLPAKKLSTALSENTAHSWGYLKRFKDQIEHLEMQASRPSEWPELAREHGLENLGCKITWA